MYILIRYNSYEYLPDDKLYYGEIEGFKGLYASAKSLELCRDELMSTLEDWVLFSIHKNIDLPNRNYLSFLELKCFH